MNVKLLSKFIRKPYLFWLLSAASQASGPAKLTEFAKYYASKDHLIAEFSQTIDNTQLKRPSRISRGSLWISKPNKFRWQMDSPEPSVIVTSGKLITFYTPPMIEGERGQAIISSTQEAISKTILAILRGDLSLLNQLHPENGPEDTLLFSPGKKLPGVRAIQVFFISPQSSEIKAISLDRAINTTKIEFTKVEFPKSVPETQYEFRPPPQTDIVR